ncbi:MAG: lysophospholipid acyltransferase family protein [Desulfatitalea sp.]
MGDACRRSLTWLVSGLAWVSGMCAFVPLGGLVVLLSLVFHPKRFHPFTRLCCRIILRALFVRVTVEGREQLHKGGTCLFVGNHVNLFDVFVFYGYIPHFFCGLELDEHFDWFFYGRIIRRLGMIPISQSSARAALQSLKIAQEALAGGTSVLILPEGGRTLDGDFQPFKRGAFLLAKRAGVDVVPVVMVGAYKILQRGRLLIRPGKIHLRFGAPIPHGRLEEMKIEAIADHVRGRMADMFTLTP